MKKSESSEGQANDLLPEVEYENPQPIVEMVPVAAEVAAPDIPPPFEAFARAAESVPLMPIKEMALPAAEVLKKIEHDEPVEGLLEKRHEIKTFDKVNSSGPTPIRNIIGAIRLPIAKPEISISPQLIQRISDTWDRFTGFISEMMRFDSYQDAIKKGFIGGLISLPIIIIVSLIR